MADIESGQYRFLLDTYVPGNTLMQTDTQKCMLSAVVFGKG